MLLFELTPQHGPSGETGTPTNWGGIGVGAQKTCNISETVQDGTNVTMTDYNRKSHTRFRLAQKSMTRDCPNFF